ncbi:MAG: dTDP-4-dehydrorhamnose reductase [Cyanobium sp. NAT70]|nr:dTDP-4-dehydrorhamnose reductase [Cyanobium sp. NAT70]
MKVLLTGAAGQLGQALVAAAPPNVELIATSRSELDLADAMACRNSVRQHRPDWVLNAGAYTAVDQAEREPELALAVNAGAPKAFADALRDSGGQMLQLSTDFVFDGSQGSPYRVDQARNPLGVYGVTKAKGEDAIEQTLGSEGTAVILRTSWVIGPVGRNFALTMLRLHRDREELGVVADQVGCPTSTLTLATACWRILDQKARTDLPPVLHWSDAGAASWYDVSVAVGELGQELGLVKQPALVQPIATADYPTPAQRPAYSLLDCVNSRIALGLSGQHWRSSLRQILQVIPPSSLKS